MAESNKTRTVGYYPREVVEDWAGWEEYKTDAAQLRRALQASSESKAHIKFYIKHDLVRQKVISEDADIDFSFDGERVKVVERLAKKRGRSRSRDLSSGGDQQDGSNAEQYPIGTELELTDRERFYWRPGTEISPPHLRGLQGYWMVSEDGKTAKRIEPAEEEDDDDVSASSLVEVPSEPAREPGTAEVDLIRHGVQTETPKPEGAAATSGRRNFRRTSQ